MTTVEVSTKIISIRGEMAHGSDDMEHETGPMATGEVIQILPDQEHCYVVAFPDHYDLTVYLSAEELNDPAQYTILERAVETTT